MTLYNVIKKVKVRKFKREEKFIDKIWSYIDFDGFDDYIGLYEAFKNLIKSEQNSFFFNDSDFKQLTIFIEYQKKIQNKIIEADVFKDFIDRYYILVKYSGTFDHYPSLQVHLKEAIIEEYPKKFGDNFEPQYIANKFLGDFHFCLDELQDILRDVPHSLRGYNIQEAFINLNQTYGQMISEDNSLHDLRYDYCEGTKAESLEYALNKVEGLEIDFKSCIGKRIPTSMADVDKALKSLWEDNRRKLSYFNELRNRFGEYEIIKIDKSKFVDIFQEISKILDNLRDFERPIIFKDFISETDDIKRREEIFTSELEKSVNKKENIALVGIMENPKARKFKWDVHGAYCLDMDKLEFGSYETIHKALSAAYSFAKKFQVENHLLTRFISLKSQREQGFDE